MKNKKTNKKIIVEELNKIDSSEFYHHWTLHNKKYFNKFAANLLSKLKENEVELEEHYGQKILELVDINGQLERENTKLKSQLSKLNTLDRDNVKEVIKKFGVICPKHTRTQFIDQIMQLIPEQGEIIEESFKQGYDAGIKYAKKML